MWDPSAILNAEVLVTGYVVFIDDGYDGAFRLGYDGRTNPSKLSVEIDGLSSRQTYKLKLAAFNKGG
jgi:hypothetical protein